MDLYKQFDYEPVSVFDYRTQRMPISRYHWHILTMWTRPILIEGKPILDFCLGVHTPVALSKSHDIYYVNTGDIDLVERIWMEQVQLPILKRMIRERVTPTNIKKHGYKKLIRKGGVSAEYVLDLSRIKGTIIVGEIPNLRDLPKAIRRIFKAS